MEERGMEEVRRKEEEALLKYSLAIQPLGWSSRRAGSTGPMETAHVGSTPAVVPPGSPVLPALRENVPNGWIREGVFKEAFFLLPPHLFHFLSPPLMPFIA